jgi:hypothetical protein
MDTQEEVFMTVRDRWAIRRTGEQRWKTKPLRRHRDRRVRWRALWPGQENRCAYEDH